MRTLLVVTVLCVCLVSGLSLKRLSGGEEELALRRLPTPEEVATSHGEGIRLYLRVMSRFHHVGRRVELHALLYNSTLDATPVRERRVPSNSSRLPLLSTMLTVITDMEGLSVGGNEIVGFTPTKAGMYQLTVTAYGTDENGVRMERIGRRVIRVVEGGLQISGATSTLQEGYLSVEVRANTTGNDGDRELTVHAEVYGTDDDGFERFACWIGGRVHVSNTSGLSNGTATAILGPNLEVDERWLAMRRVVAPLKLRNVRVVDRLVPLHVLEEMPLHITSGDNLRMARRRLSIRLPHGTLPEEMRYGRRPLSVAPPLPSGTPGSTSTPTNATKKSGLILVHGYCVVYNPFRSVKELFTNPHLFLHPGSSLTNDQFAQLIAQYATDEGLDTFGIVAHSQGGLASLHLHSHYWTNLELATGGRLIQTVGSPFRGTLLAGNVARLGELFGVACGPNYDLTREGARIWLSDISPKAREDVYYYTSQAGVTTNATYPHDYCVGASNWFLDHPNDGVTELTYAVLEGGNHVSHTVGECHTPDMNWPAETVSRDRAREMNANAAR